MHTGPLHSWAMFFSSLHVGLGDLLSQEKPQSTAWLELFQAWSKANQVTRAYTWHCQTSPFRAWARMLESGIWDWNLQSAGASRCVRSMVAMLLPTVCAGQQNKCHVAKNNQVTNNWKTKHRCPSLKPNLFQVDVLIVPNHKEKSFKDADRKARLFSATEMSWNVFSWWT